MFQKLDSVISELKKALTASGTPDLQPFDLEQALHEELLKLQPLAELLDFKQAEGLLHQYRVKTGHPMGWFEGEAATATNKNGTYTTKSVALKIGRIWGSVTGFAQKVDEKFINALAEELSGSLQGMADLMEFGALFGTADDIGYTGDAYQYTGILPRVYKYAPANVIDGGSAKITLAKLDEALAAMGKHRQTRNDPGLWLMSLTMKQVVDGLQTKVQMPLQSVQLKDGKIEMAAYGGKPILETDYVTPEAVVTSPTAVAVLKAGVGANVAGTYKYKISSVSAYGEQIAGAASADVVMGGADFGADVSWTHDDNAVLYMIWRNVGAGTFYLLDIIPALTYDANGVVNGVVEAYIDLGARAVSAKVKPLATGEQVIIVVNTNPARGMSFIGMVDDMGRQLGQAVSYVELARIKDTYDYMLKQYMALKLVYPNLVAVIRHAKLS